VKKATLILAVCLLFGALAGCTTNKTPGATAQQGDPSFQMLVEDTFTITGRGTVVTGIIDAGTLCVNDKIDIVKMSGERITTVVAGIEISGEMPDSATAGSAVGVLLKNIDSTQIEAGDWLTAAGTSLNS